LESRGASGASAVSHPEEAECGIWLDLRGDPFIFDLILGYLTQWSI
jgi:hypothetical protein